jgi:hypothetical protein
LPLAPLTGVLGQDGCDGALACANARIEVALLVGIARQHADVSHDVGRVQYPIGPLRREAHECVPGRYALRPQMSRAAVIGCIGHDARCRRFRQQCSEPDSGSVGVVLLWCVLLVIAEPGSCPPRGQRG